LPTRPSAAPWPPSCSRRTAARTPARPRRAIDVAADRDDVAVPADWPDNAEFEDRVLLEPPGDVATAEPRVANAEAEGYECLDWWFCLKDLPE